MPNHWEEGRERELFYQRCLGSAWARSCHSFELVTFARRKEVEGSGPVIKFSPIGPLAEPSVLTFPLKECLAAYEWFGQRGGNSNPCAHFHFLAARSVLQSVDSRLALTRKLESVHRFHISLTKKNIHARRFVRLSEFSAIFVVGLISHSREPRKESACECEPERKSLIISFQVISNERGAESFQVRKMCNIPAV